MEYQNYDESFDGKPEEFELEQHIQQPQVQQQPQPSTRPPRRSTKSLSSAYAAWAQSQAKGSAFCKCSRRNIYTLEILCFAQKN